MSITCWFILYNSNMAYDMYNHIKHDESKDTRYNNHIYAIIQT